jgi:hypothetical protein
MFTLHKIHKISKETKGTYKYVKNIGVQVLGIIYTAMICLSGVGIINVGSVF